MSRYEQQIKLSTIGTAGQTAILQARVCIIGSGGLGTIVASYLAAMGVGYIKICDFDTIALHNLHRQFIYTPEHVGAYKANILKQQLSLQNPEIYIESHTIKIDKESIDEIGSEIDIICDCSDNGYTRMLLNNYCASNHIVLIHGAVSQWEGYLTVFHYKNRYTLQDLFDFSDYLKIENCNDLGIMSPICGIIGSYMASETIKIILNNTDVLDGQLLYINTENNTHKTYKLQHRNQSY